MEPFMLKMPTYVITIPARFAINPKSLMSWLVRITPDTNDITNPIQRNMIALLSGSTFRTQIACTISHTIPNKPQVITSRTSTITQLSPGGEGYMSAGEGAHWGAAGVGIGILPITCETGTQSSMPSLLTKSDTRMFPNAT